jgi:hypothetical protein
MGWTQQGLVIADIFEGPNFEINENGAFFYNTTPGANNLQTTINPSALPAIDQFGNIALGGTTFYSQDIAGNYYAMNFEEGNGFQIFQSSSQSAGWGVAFMSLTATDTGGTDPLMVLATGLAGSPQSAVITMGLSGTDPQITIGQENDSSSPADIQIGTVPGVSPVSLQRIAALDTFTPTGGSLETWHAATLGSGITNTGSGPHMQYRLVSSPPRTVQVIGDINAGTVTADGTVITTLPAGYRPATNQANIVLLPGTGTAPPGPRLFAATTGQIEMEGISSLTSPRLVFNHFISLDA